MEQIKNSKWVAQDEIKQLQLVSMEQGNALKKLGFNLQTDEYFFFGDKGWESLCDGNGMYANGVASDKYIARPTVELALRWIRMEFNVFVLILPSTLVLQKEVPVWWDFRVLDLTKKPRKVDWAQFVNIMGDPFSSYDEALIAALTFCLDYLTKKKKK